MEKEASQDQLKTFQNIYLILMKSIGTKKLKIVLAIAIAMM